MVASLRCSSSCSRDPKHSPGSLVSGKSSMDSLRDEISHSIGKIDSDPCISWNKVNHVVFLTKFWSSQSVGYNIK